MGVDTNGTKHGLGAKIAFAFVCVCAAAAFGFYSSSNSWNGMIVLRDSLASDSRGPAAIRKVFDFSELQGSALKLASQKRLVTDARVIASQTDVGLELGHFVTKGDSGERLFACEYFDKLSLTFEAEGIAQDGEKAIMHVEAPCAMGRDLNRMAPIWIPYKKIVSGKPADMDLAYDGDSQTRFRFENMPATWPKKWVLTSVRLFNSEEHGREIAISREELRDISDTPIRMEW